MKRTLKLAGLLGTLVVTLAACSQKDPTPAFQRATQTINAGNLDDGIAALDSLLSEHPGFSQGWARLGQAYRTKQDFERSLNAFETGVKLDPSNANLIYNVGLSHAILDHDDQAFGWLLRAKQTGTVNVTNLDGNPASDNLRDDPRYASLFPSGEEMSDPFEEQAQIIHEFRGENKRDQFGWIARSIGDVDGDGANDFVTSAPTNKDGGAAAGKVYVYSGRTGDKLWDHSGTTANGQLGSGVEAAGDTNGDGIPDVIASAYYANEVFVYSGNDGKQLLAIIGADSTGVFGAGVKGIGDIDGDGRGDLLVGEPFQIWGGPLRGGDLSEPGRAHIYSGSDGSVLLTLSGELPGDGFGSAVAGKTTDGTTFFMVGAPNAGPSSRGRTYVYEGLSETPSFVIDADESGVNLGAMFLSVIGDVDGDGTQDMYASDWADSAKGPSTGKVYIHSGSDGHRIYTLGGETAGDGFGIGISDAGDVDNDGHDDLLIGAWQHAGLAPSGGKLYLHSGRNGKLVYTITGKIPGETLGFDTTGIGDVNTDGRADFLVTSAWSVVNGFQSGRVFIVSGR